MNLDAILTHLPEPARDKAVRLRQAADDAAALAREATDRRNALRPDLLQVRGELNDTRRLSPVDGRGVGDHRAEGLRTALARLQMEADRLDHLIDRRGADHQRRRALVNAIERALADAPADHIRHVDGPEPKLRRGESNTQAVQRVRAELEALAAERAAVLSAPIPSATAKSQLRAEVETLAARGRPDVSALLAGRGGIGWPGLDAAPYPTPAAVFGRGQAETPMLDGAAILAWMARDEIIERLEAAIDAHADDERALTDEQRTERLAEIARRELEAERAEEFYITQAETDCVVIERRPDASPLAVLGVEIINEPVDVAALSEAA